MGLQKTYVAKKRFTLCLRKYRPKRRPTTRGLLHLEIFQLKYKNPDFTRFIYLNPVGELTTSHIWLLQAPHGRTSFLKPVRGLCSDFTATMCKRLPYLVKLSIYDRRACELHMKGNAGDTYKILGNKIKVVCFSARVFSFPCALH